MPTLILTLPLPGAAPGHDFVLSPDGQQIASEGHAGAAMLPRTEARGTEVVAVLPARALSWHPVRLPARVLAGLLRGRMDAARARVLLSGVLEEQVLEDPEQLHFAVCAAAGAAPGNEGAAWVAVCNRAWLQGSLQALEQAGHPVARIVAECTPQPSGPALLLLTPAQSPAQMLLCTDQGVAPLPWSSASLALAQAQEALEVRAEPAVMALAESHFGTQTRLQTRGQALLQAARSDWNLAQLELSAGSGGRWVKRLAGAWQQLRHAPAWRPLRWGLLALVLVQLVGLNTLAWRQRALLEDQRAAIQGVLTQTFPEVQLVIDAPLQMQRAVDDLARARGLGAGADLGRVLSALGQQAPPGLTVSGIDLRAGELRLQLSASDPATLPRLASSLQGQGLAAQWQDHQLVIDTRETR